MVKYIMIGVADINGFIDVGCSTYLTYAIGSVGVADTVTREIAMPYFGRLCKGRDVLLLDNASTHMS